jgi:hypothetical protein
VQNLAALPELPALRAILSAGTIIYTLSPQLARCGCKLLKELSSPSSTGDQDSIRER